VISSEGQRDVTVKDKPVRFVVSIPLFEAVTRRAYADVSVRTNDGALASTAVPLEYQHNEFVLGLRWEKVAGKWPEAVAALRLWRWGALRDSLVLKEWNRKARLTATAMSQMHLKNGPRHRHWYVNFVATNPYLQGQGYGSMIMRKERADCFLDCGNEKNKGFYERFGFVVVASPRP
jgi:ribosomal protein S18 acetylase RimI-like enzyme